MWEATWVLVEAIVTLSEIVGVAKVIAKAAKAFWEWRKLVLLTMVALGKVVALEARVQAVLVATEVKGQAKITAVVAKVIAAAIAKAVAVAVAGGTTTAMVKATEGAVAVALVAGVAVAMLKAAVGVATVGIVLVAATIAWAKWSILIVTMGVKGEAKVAVASARGTVTGAKTVMAGVKMVNSLRAAQKRTNDNLALRSAYLR